MFELGYVFNEKGLVAEGLFKGGLQLESFVVNLKTNNFLSYHSRPLIVRD